MNIKIVKVINILIGVDYCHYSPLMYIICTLNLGIYLTKN